MVVWLGPAVGPYDLALGGKTGGSLSSGASQGDRAEALGREVAAYASVGKLGRTSGPLDWMVSPAMRTLHATRTVHLSDWGRSTTTTGVAVIGHFDCTLHPAERCLESKRRSSYRCVGW
jgi:hypothetical protein